MISNGLEGVYAAESKLSFIDGKKGQLVYAGYDIKSLALKTSFEEVCYLLWNQELPNESQLKSFTQSLAANYKLTPRLKDFIAKNAADATPMEFLRTAISLDSFDDTQKVDNSLEINRDKALRLIALIPTIAAAYSRVRQGLDIVESKSELGHAGNFLYMLNGMEPTAEATHAFDCALVLHADHGFNASTFAARVTIATLSDMHSAVTSAVGTLKGPLHGGANTQVMQLLTKIGEIDQIEAHLEEIFTNKEKIMGFGHRVYKTMDPRASILKNLSQSICKQQGQEKFYIMSEKIHEIVSERKGLNPNVDFYSASLYHALGISHDMFTVIFSISRMAGWSAHILEQVKNNRLIRPRAHYSGHELRDFIPMNQR
jgi:citrate synthase